MKKILINNVICIGNVCKISDMGRQADDYFSPDSILLISLAIILSVCIISFLKRSLITISIMTKRRISSVRGNFRVILKIDIFSLIKNQ